MSDVHYIFEKLPSVEQVVGLYRSVGWSAYLEQDSGRLMNALTGSSLVISAWHGEDLVGLARVISDGVTVFFLQDLLVNPAYQQRGIGSRLMELCLERFQSVDRGVLITDGTPQQLSFYRKMGFIPVDELKKGSLTALIRLRNQEIPPDPQL